jgi:DNA-binding Lrp family transcriptional regulator
MSEMEYDIIDELYFVTSFRDVAKALNLPADELCSHLAALIRQGYIKAFYPDPDTEITFDENQFRAHCREYFYLATKAGLIQHNSR